MKKFLILAVALASLSVARAAIDAIVGDKDVGVVAVSAPGVSGANAIQILSVPFEKCMGNGDGVEVMLGDLVSTYSLVAKTADGDKGLADQLIVLTTNVAVNNGTTLLYYYYWLKDVSGVKTWTPINTTLLNGTVQESITPDAASAFAIARGKGFWLKRPASADATSLYLKGQLAAADSTVTIKKGLNLISLGALADISLNSTSLVWGSPDARYAGTSGYGMDYLMTVKTDGSGDIDQTFFYHANEAVNKWWNQDGQYPDVKPGQGLWYVRRGNEADFNFTPTR
jgi:hypothetical protein